MTYSEPHGTGETVVQRARNPFHGRVFSSTAQFLAGDGTIGIFLLGSLMSVAWSLESSNWARTPSLFLVVLLGAATGLALSRVRWWGPFLVLGGMALGLLTVVLLTSGDANAPGVASKIFQTTERILLWGRAASGGGISADPLPFVFLLSMLTWLVAFFCAWLVFRLRNYWGAVCIGGAVLVINMSMSPSARTAMFGLFMLSALLLRVRLHASETKSAAPCPASQQSGRSNRSPMGSGVLLAVTVMAGALLIPAGKDSQQFGRVYDLMHWPVDHFSSDFDRLFAGLGGNVPSSFRVFSDQMPLGGSVTLSDTASLIVQSPVPVYLKAHNYDTYISSGWTMGPSETLPQTPLPAFMSDTSTSAAGDEEAPRTSLITVKPLFPTDTRFTAGDVESIDVPGELKVYAAPVYTVNLRFGGQNDTLPESLRLTARNLQTAAWNSNSRRQPGVTLDSLQKVVPSDIIVLEIEYQRLTPVSVKLMRKAPVPPDIVSFNVPGGSQSSGTYEMSTRLSQATADDLRLAGTAYPGWVADRYLQLPLTVPSRVKELASQITKGTSTPYDMAKTIETYLRNNYEYNLTIDPPPYDGDGVDFFLFASKKGYCDYFSSAMAVLLREAGVPSRVVKGYAPGQKAKDGSFLVRDRDAHSWPEAYFPGYGWIDFEPTPSRPAVEDPADPPQAAEAQTDSDASPPADDVTDEEFLPGDASAGPPYGDVQGGWLRVLGWRILPPLALLLLILYVWRRAASKPADPESAYRRLLLAGRLAGIRAQLADTPYEYARSVGSHWPEAGDDAWIVADAYVRSSYGGKLPTSGDLNAIANGWRSIRSSLIRRLFRIQR